METSAENNLLSKTQILLNDSPCIDYAVKNFLATILGRRQVLYNDNKVCTLGSEGDIIELYALERLEPSVLQKLCALVLRHIEVFKLEEPLIWAKNHPQRPHQTGVERIEEIATYKALYVVWNKVKKSNNGTGKVVKVFGRIALEYIWNDLKPIIIAKNDIVKSEIVNYFLDCFLSIDSHGCKNASPLDLESGTHDSSTNRESIGDLVWAKNFRSAIQKRCVKRNEQAKLVNRSHSPG